MVMVRRVISLGDQVMRLEEPRERANEPELVTPGQFTAAAGLEETPAWEEVSAGRYMPRRIKGSCKGRALG
jgi:hypothetical protein